jgi:hypothetical protein
MQPLHDGEARWFFQWDRLELARGIGLSLSIIAIFFFISSVAGLLALPFAYSARLLLVGILVFLLSYCLDSFGKPTAERKIRCRACRTTFRMGEAMAQGWRCGKCGTAGRFDNPP